MRDPLPHLPALLVAGVFLLILVEQDQQVNVLSSLEVQIQIAVAAALPLSPPRIRDPCLPNIALTRPPGVKAFIYGFIKSGSLNC